MHSLHSYFIRPGDPAVPIVYRSTGCATGGPSRSAGSSPSSTASRSSSCRRRSSWPSAASTTRRRCPTCPCRRRYRRWRTGTWDSTRWPRATSGSRGRSTCATSTTRRGSNVRTVRASTPRIACGCAPRRAARRPAAARLRAHLRLRPHPARLGAHPSRAGRGADPVITASLDHAMWFHRPFRADEWFLYDTTSPSASGGRGLAKGKIFARDGRQIATVVQEGMLRMPSA